MMTRFALVAAAIGIGALALWHPAPRPPVQTLQATAAAPPQSHPRRRETPPAASAMVVYVVGAVARPGLYRMQPGTRIAGAVAAAGGLAASADRVAVNLAARVGDGDEIAVPAVGQTLAVSAPHARASRAGRHRRVTPQPPPIALDVNTAGAQELAAVPGIGRAIAARIVEMRERDGAFASLDELLDVAGMTQSRLERAQAYLKSP